MRFHPRIEAVLTGLAIALVCALSVASHAQASQAGTAEASTSRFITLDPPTGWELQDHLRNSKGELLPETPPDFRRLGEATVGQEAALHTLTLRFHAAARIAGFSVTKDFRIEQGGSCVEGNFYESGSTCSVLVRFTPQGPGTRAGKLTVTHSASATPDAFGLGGYSYMPVLSFIPSIIATVPGTYPSGKGLLNDARNLAVDGGDDLYLADSGNDAVRWMDSSGTLKTIASVADPYGVGVDSYQDVWFSSPGTDQIWRIYPNGSLSVASGTNSDACSESSPCLLANEALDLPASIGLNAATNTMVFEEDTIGWGAAVSQVQPSPPTYIRIYDPFSFSGSPASGFAIDAAENLYTAETAAGVCQIVSQALSNAEDSASTYTTIVGGRACGFSGDGGQAGGAEIGAKIGQIAFDSGGNLYFSDTNNQRVRRVDYATGIIRTIAGNGTAGYTNDGGAATYAELSSPTGVGVDSQGQVYVISGAAATGTAQVVRKVGTTGIRNFGNQLKGTPSAPLIALVTNTGDYSLQLTNTLFTGANSGDFSVDPGTTSCLLSAEATLESGGTCQIGFVFTPSAGGARGASFTMLDNSATDSNTIVLYGTGTLPPATLTITSPKNGASFTSGSSVVFTVTVTSSSGPAPTGTVQFKVDGTNYGTPWTISSGSASTSVGGLSVTSHTLSATYSGDSNYAAGGPISVSITVTSTSIAHPPTVLMSPMAKAGTSCVPRAFNVTVSSTSGVLPTGTVDLVDGGHGVSRATLIDGKAVLSSPPLPAGRHSFTTEYGGDAHNLPAVSPAVVEIVSQSGQCSQPGEPAGAR